MEGRTLRWPGCCAEKAGREGLPRSRGLLDGDAAADEGDAEFAFVGGEGAAFVGEGADLAAFHGGELLLKREDVEGAARAGAETFLLGVEGLFREFEGGARGAVESQTH